MKIVPPPAGVAALLLCACFRHDCLAQNVTDTVTSSAVGFESFTHPGVNDAKTQNNLGTVTTSADDSNTSGLTVRAHTTGYTSAGAIGVSADGAAIIDPTVAATNAVARNYANIRYRDTLSFYSRSVSYAAPLELHLQAQLDGTVWGTSQGSQLPNDWATYNGTASFRFSVGDGGSRNGSDQDNITFGFNGTGMSVTESGDRTLDVYLEVPNSPDFFYYLDMAIDYSANVMATTSGAGGDTLDAEYSFLFGHTLAWAGIVSATTRDGTPVSGLVISSESSIDYSRSYVTPALSSVPEPSTYAWAGLAVLGFAAYLRKRRQRTSPDNN